MKKLLIIFTLLLSSIQLQSQNLKPGFDPQEALMILNISAHQFDSSRWSISRDLPDLPNDFKLTYRSKVVGIENRWDVFTNDDAVVISIRGTVGSMRSWLENFHAAMIPATGSIRLTDSTMFDYKLAANEQAHVHVGWVYGLGSMAKGIEEKVNEFYNKGYRKFYLVGFSQGAAIVQLLSSYLYYLPEGRIPKEIKFKTFAFACPKPGDTFYANDYLYIHRGGWEYRIVNSEDWVPRLPFAIQRIEDMPEISPFAEIDEVFKSLKPLQRMVLKSIYNKTKRKIDKAQAQLTKILGDMVGKFLKKSYQNMEKMEFSPAFNYSAAGSTIIISSAEIPEDLSPTRKLFFHHLPLMYYKRMKANFEIKD